MSRASKDVVSVRYVLKCSSQNFALYETVWNIGILHIFASDYGCTELAYSKNYQPYFPRRAT